MSFELTGFLLLVFNLTQILLIHLDLGTEARLDFFEYHAKKFRVRESRNGQSEMRFVYIEYFIIMVYSCKWQIAKAY